jgi:ubiquinol-cytochrome c reductase cytochrome c1 subunit
MIRLLAILAGLGFVLVSSISFISGFFAWMGAEKAEETAEYKHHEYPHSPENGWSFAGPFGKFDRQQLQRGFAVYQQSCAGCHSMNFVAYRNLQEIGYSEAEVRAIASQGKEVSIIDPVSGDVGKTTRKATPADILPAPFANDIQARAANNNAVPPDLSLIVKARKDGSNYVYSLLTGYKDPPADVEVPPGLYYNPVFHSIKIAMPPPLAEGAVTYSDGTQATVDQMAQDVTAFLTWAAEPNLERRHQMGWAVLIFLFAATTLAYLAYRNVWADRKVKKKNKRVAA